MKKILSIVLCKNTASAPTVPSESAELLFIDENAPKTLYEIVKQTKGKYVVIIDADFTFNEADFESFIKAVDESSADILLFDGGYALKASTLKGVPSKLYSDRFYAEIYTAFNSDEIAGIDLKPFIFTEQRAQYSFADDKFEELLEEFKRSKAKLSKAVYTFIFDILCERLVTYYIQAMIAIYRKEMLADELSEFDKRLKNNIVLYLAVEQRFPITSLAKLREKNFKISFLQYNKFKKAVNR